MMRSSGQSSARCMPSVSSTTPRLGARWPPVSETVSTSVVANLLRRASQAAPRQDRAGPLGNRSYRGCGRHSYSQSSPYPGGRPRGVRITRPGYPAYGEPVAPYKAHPGAVDAVLRLLLRSVTAVLAESDSPASDAYSAGVPSEDSPSGDISTSSVSSSDAPASLSGASDALSAA